MSDKIRDDGPLSARDPFAPKRQPSLPERPDLTSAPRAPGPKELNAALERDANSARNAHQDGRESPDPNSWPEAVPQPPQSRFDQRSSSLTIRVLLVILF